MIKNIPIETDDPKTPAEEEELDSQSSVAAEKAASEAEPNSTDQPIEEESANAQDPSFEDNEKAEKTKEENIDWKDRCLRSMAELDNATRTIPKRIQEGISRFKRAHFVELLELSDALDRALSQLPGQDDSWRQGLETMQRMMTDILAKQGVTRIETAGKVFDPALHEVVSTQNNPEFEEGMIIAELRSGWMMDGNLLRASMVVVASS